MTARAVYTAIQAVAADLAQDGIAKIRVNELEGYRYRSIDDVLDRLAPLLCKHQLCVLPRVLDRVVTERVDDKQQLLLNVTLKVAFSLTSSIDGSSHTVEVYGEALDGGDKGTAKAMSSAYKMALLQTFCIPVTTAEDSDRKGYKLAAKVHEPEPVQGWKQWCEDIADIIGVCETAKAIGIVQERNRELLKALSRERPDLYSALGEAFTSRRGLLSEAPRSSQRKKAGVRQPSRARPAKLAQSSGKQTAKMKQLEHA